MGLRFLNQTFGKFLLCRYAPLWHYNTYFGFTPPGTGLLRPLAILFCVMEKLKCDGPTEGQTDVKTEIVI